MKTKIKDIRYCGVNRKKISFAKPTLNSANAQHFITWVKERYLIHIRKDVYKQKKPWTKNNILQQYRFTNVRREHDKQTIWLIKNIVHNTNYSYQQKILQIILFRLFNKSETIEHFKQPVLPITNWDLVEKTYLQIKKKHPKYSFFSNAFYTSGPKQVANKLFTHESVVLNVFNLITLYEKQNIIKHIQESNSQKDVYDLLLSLPGIGSFLAYQIFVDFTYMQAFSFSENEFTIAGPGCKKGLDLLFEDTDGLTYEELLFWLRDNQHSVLEKYGYDAKHIFTDQTSEEKYLNIMSLENCMCELSKYIRAITNTGRPRMKYKGYQ